MKLIGDTINVTQGEKFTIDMSLESIKGHPLLVYNNWRNPFLLLSIASLENPTNDSQNFRYWLDLTTIYVENSSGVVSSTTLKKFVSTEALEIPEFYTTNVVSNLQSQYSFITSTNVSDYLFCVDEAGDGEFTYKYYNGTSWIEYFFRFLKEIDTSGWPSGNYYYMLSMVCGESLPNAVESWLISEGKSAQEAATTWENITTKIALVADETKRAEFEALLASGKPLMDRVDLSMTLLDKKSIFVKPNLEGGSF